MTEQSTVLLRIEDIDQAFLPGGSFDPQSENHYDLVIEKFKQDYSADGFFIDVQFDGLVVQISPNSCLLYTSPSPRDATLSRMPSSA